MLSSPKIYLVTITHQRSSGPNKLPFSQELIFMLALPKIFFGHNNPDARRPLIRSQKTESVFFVVHHCLYMSIYRKSFYTNSD